MIKNSKNSFYRVNDSVLFDDEWFHYILSSPLPPYYRVIPVIFKTDSCVELELVLDYFQKHFSFCVIDKYLSKDHLCLRVVTCKSLEDIMFLFNRFNKMYGLSLIF